MSYLKLPRCVFASETAYLKFNKSGWMQRTGGFSQQDKELCTLNGTKLQYDDVGLPDWTVKTWKYWQPGKSAQGTYAEVWPNSDQAVGLKRGFGITKYTGGTFFITFHCKDEASKQHIISKVKTTDTDGGVFNYANSSGPLSNPYAANHVWTNGLDVIAANIGNNRFGYILGTELWSPAYVTHISVVIAQTEFKKPYLRKSEY
jgi:hypothetical protein